MGDNAVTGLVTITVLIQIIAMAGIHLEKDMCVPFGHTVARTVCLFGS